MDESKKEDGAAGVSLNISADSAISLQRLRELADSAALAELQLSAAMPETVRFHTELNPFHERQTIGYGEDR